MPLFQPSFRGRLRLFFAVIVIVPMIAVGVVLFQVLDASEGFKLDSTLTQAEKSGRALYDEDRRDAAAALELFVRDVALATAIDRKESATAQQRVDLLARRTGAEWIEIKVTGFGTFASGASDTIAAASAELQDSGGVDRGTITASTTTAEGFATDAKRLLGVEVRVDRGGSVAATTIPASAELAMPEQRGDDVAIGGTEFRTTFFVNAEPVAPREVTVHLLAKVPPPDQRATVLVIGLTI